MPDTGDRLTAIETILSRMEKELFGNGQPGVIDSLQKRVGNLEKWQWKVTAGAGVVGAILGYILR